MKNWTIIFTTSNRTIIIISDIRCFFLVFFCFFLNVIIYIYIYIGKAKQVKNK